MTDASAPGRRPAELSLQEMEREARRLLRAADLEERKSAACAREVEALKAEIAMLKAQQAGLERDLSAKPLDIEAMEKRVDALAIGLERMKRGAEPPPNAGSMSARMVAPGPAPAPPAEGAEPDDSEPGDAGALEARAPAARRPTPVPLPPPVLIRPRFHATAAHPGATVRIELEAPGFTDGVEVVLELWDRARATNLGETSAFVEAEVVHAEILVPREAATTGGVVVCARAGRAQVWSPALEVTAA